MSVQIIVDSTVDLPQRCLDKVRVVPLTIRFGEEEWVDGVTITKQRFYERLVESDQLPTTSQATPAAFAGVFEEVARAGDSAVVLTISSKLSGTYQSACLAAEAYPNIFVVDTQTAAIGSGILAEYALTCAAGGMPAAALAQHLREKRDDVCLVALLDTLEYLKRGGRISKTVAFAGGLLNIKPVITVQDGEVVLIGKARGSRQGNNLLVEKIRATGGIDFINTHLESVFDTDTRGCGSTTQGKDTTDLDRFVSCGGISCGGGSLFLLACTCSEAAECQQQCQQQCQDLVASFHYFSSLVN